MMKTSVIRCAVLLLAACVLSSCGGRKGSGAPAPSPFPYVEVPVMLRGDAQESVSFLLDNYWNRFLDTSRIYRRDTACVAGVPVGEFGAAVHDYVAVLNMAASFPEDFARNGSRVKESIFSLLDRTVLMQSRDTSGILFDSMTAALGYWLYDPNSDLRNEDIYSFVAEYLSGCPLVDVTVRGRYVFEKDKCALNSVLSPAADFVFADAKGREGSLYGIEAGYVLMFFSNPGCEACLQIIGELQARPLRQDGSSLSDLIAEGTLAVLNIYVDSDLEAWRKYLPEYPSDWINAYDPSQVMNSGTLYYVRAIPSLYLLDRDKRVLFKDASPARVISYLRGVL